MKILHVINLMKLGGAQSLLVPLTKIQKEEGNDVIILQLVPQLIERLSIKLKRMGLRS